MIDSGQRVFPVLYDLQVLLWLPTLHRAARNSGAQTLPAMTYFYRDAKWPLLQIPLYGEQRRECSGSWQSERCE
jgi:hypothetical protein